MKGLRYFCLGISPNCSHKQVKLIASRLCMAPISPSPSIDLVIDCAEGRPNNTRTRHQLKNADVPFMMLADFLDFAQTELVDPSIALLKTPLVQPAPHWKVDELSTYCV